MFERSQHQLWRYVSCKEKIYVMIIHLDVEQHIPKSLRQSQEHYQEEVTMVLYNEKEQLYLETDASYAALGASL